MLDISHTDQSQPPLGQSGEDYLEAILVLSRQKPVVRVRDVAEHLGVSRPSVVAAVAALERRGLVNHEHYGGVELTAGGVAAAEVVQQRHDVLYRFLRDVLDVSERVAADDACRLEHALSCETAERLVQFMEREGGVRPFAVRTPAGEDGTPDGTD